jgi:Fe-S-cluster containining protein
MREDVCDGSANCHGCCQFAKVRRVFVPVDRRIIVAKDFEPKVDRRNGENAICERVCEDQRTEVHLMELVFR